MSAEITPLRAAWSGRGAQPSDAAHPNDDVSLDECEKVGI